MDVLGLEDTPVVDQKVVHEEFLEQLRRDPEQGWYESGLPWKGHHPPLPSNEANSLKRLGCLVQRLKKTEYYAIIQDQLKEGIVEHATEPPSEPVFYLPHHPVIRKSAESTKIRIVYVASSKTGSQPSLNDCLNNGPPLQNQLFKVLVRGRFHPVALNGDIRKAFVQVRIRPDHRDAMRLHWLEDKDSQRICTLRFTRALFGMGPSPFLLGGVLLCHLNASKEKHPKHAAEIEKKLYVDDVTGGTSVHEVREKEQISVEIFKEALFDLHKWQSNIKELEQDEQSNVNDGSTFAKQLLGNETGNLLGMKWDKEADTIQVILPPDESTPTKRGILGELGRENLSFDPLGLITPTTLQGKFLYREACEQKCKWDDELPDKLSKHWRK